jgi:hypothetical protein
MNAFLAPPGGLGKMPGLYFSVESGAQAHLAARLTRTVEKVRVYDYDYDM